MCLQYASGTFGTEVYLGPGRIKVRQCIGFGCESRMRINGCEALCNLSLWGIQVDLDRLARENEVGHAYECEGCEHSLGND